ncbi:MAG: MOSC domain-containing protein [Bacteroidales bacterium]|nr:MOSC domain-containing protein [Bacteroidales bacterium]
MANSTITVLSVNVSENKGTIKTAVSEIECNSKGVVGDAHAGSWHRQVSLLGMESIAKFEGDAKRSVKPGEFAENITTQGIVLYETAPFDKLIIGKVELEITQIGKQCHGSNCAIFKEVGNCVMPVEGIFARVIKEGKIKPGAKVIYQPKVFRVLVLTLSDRASRGEYEDLSGPEIVSQLESFFADNRWHHKIEHKIIADDRDSLRFILRKAKEEKYDMVFTTGGTGIGPRDITPEVAMTLIDKEIPGIMESIRLKFGAEKPNALLSRGVAGVMDESLLYVLPGSVRAIKEYMGEIFKTLRHLIFMQRGVDIH